MPQMTHAEKAEIYDGAADYVEEHGLHKGDLAPIPDDTTTRHLMWGRPACSIGAMMLVGGAESYWDVDLQRWQHGNDTAVERTCQAINRFQEILELENVPDWSDNLQRPTQEILDGFRYAAKQERILDDRVA